MNLRSKMKDLTPMLRQLRVSIVLMVVAVMALATPALAHHPFGGATPNNWVQGLLSGMGHPVIGPDHLVFTLLVGVLATRFKPGWAVPAAFLLAALAGTGLHLMSLDLPAPEFIISLSVLIFGVLAVYGNRFNIAAVALLAVLAGLFHGYAYGEAIVGASMTPLLSYLIGFTVVQGAIAASAFWIIQRGIDPSQLGQRLRYAGLVTCGAGAAFLSAVVLS
ncbi:HupE/UreJ family protein [Leptothoe sp. PORK10 BA2]|uniref:HupE/UreJ family protein n=1 Tax=Leptothoe sp. PORK10 BA2 TaxID=3110254 RepID=UPI002B21662B|nr:HupE/UreJ family protein [Leptothoe sp. PORK10 BA2]MEA5464668.1 HupE/UreJ family protein [Leptothoe sp. PORK10 BA2]